MGEETSFLKNLQRQGFQMLDHPGAMVYQSVLLEACTVQWLRRRAYTLGRGQIRLRGWHRRDIYARSKILWYMFLAVDECYTVLLFLTGLVFRDSKRNCEATVNAMMRFGRLHETANQVFKRFSANVRNVKAELSKQRPV